jgi:hypothetical protein
MPAGELGAPRPEVQARLPGARRHLRAADHSPSSNPSLRQGQRATARLRGAARQSALAQSSLARFPDHKILCPLAHYAPSLDGWTIDVVVGRRRPTRASLVAPQEAATGGARWQLESRPWCAERLRRRTRGHEKYPHRFINYQFHLVRLIAASATRCRTYPSAYHSRRYFREFVPTTGAGGVAA